MTITLHSHNPKNNYQKVVEAALRLSLDEQRRLRDELSGITDVHLSIPSKSKKAKREGLTLAETVRAELSASNTGNETLDETMQQLRRREWSS